MIKVFVLNTGGTLGMSGNPEKGEPLKPAKDVNELMNGVQVPEEVQLTLKDFPRKMDSTNICHSDRIEMAELIRENYEENDAFMILHGTDSLAKTASALCMIFKDSLQKPIFVEGAQTTKEEIGSEVRMQLENTLRMIRSFVRNSIVGVFNLCIGDVWDASRLQKKSESDYVAFYTPGRNPVAQAHPRITLYPGLLRKENSRIVAQGLKLDTQIESRVGTIRVSADTPPEMLSLMIERKVLKGVILEGKGAGNIPDRSWKEETENSISWIEAVRKATENGVIVAILSPFDEGRVDLNRYELGKKAKEAGAISLKSLTPDMADFKLRMAIATHPDSPEEIERCISTDFVGEILSGTEDI